MMNILIYRNLCDYINIWKHSKWRSETRKEGKIRIIKYLYHKSIIMYN